MVRRILLGVALGIAIVVGGLFLWARSVLGQDTVRAAVEAQLLLQQGDRIGGDVAIGVLQHVLARLRRPSVRLSGSALNA